MADTSTEAQSRLDPDQLAAFTGENDMAAAPAPNQSQEPQFNLPGMASGQSSSVTLGMPVIDPEAQRRKEEQSAALAERTKSATKSAKSGMRRKSEELGKATMGLEAQSEDNKAAEAEYNKQVQPLLDRQQKLQDQYDAAVAKREGARAKAATDIETMDTWAKRIAAEPLHDAWAEAGTGLKIAAIAAMALGSASQAIYGDKTNPVVDQIKGALDRDLMFQKLHIQKARDDFSTKNLLMNQFMKTNEHAELAQDKAFVTGMNGIIGRLEANKALLRTPQMRENIEKTIAQLKMQVAGKQADIEAQMGGMDIRGAQVEAQLLKEMGGLNETLKLTRAQTNLRREARLQHKQTEADQQLEIPGWAHEPGSKATSPKEAQELRQTEADTFKATKSLEDVKNLVGKPVRSLPSFLDLKAAVNRAVVKLKGKGLVNAGANFTEMERQLIQAGYISAKGDWLKALDPGAARRIQESIDDLWTDVATAMHERGYKSHGHKVFEDE